jgi:HPt (histidine-containing phosphotransfer) domain-containing protein
VTNPTETTPPPGQSADNDPRPPINEAWLLRMRTTKPKFLASLFEVFLADEPTRMSNLGDAVCSGDLEMVRYLAHSIKGAAATLGMERLCDASRELEHAAKAGQAEALAQQYTAMLEEMEKVFEIMRA